MHIDRGRSERRTGADDEDAEHQQDRRRQRPWPRIEHPHKARPGAHGGAVLASRQRTRPRRAAANHRQHQWRADESDRDASRESRVEIERQHRAIGAQHERAAHQRGQRHEHGQARGLRATRLAQQIRRDQADIRQRSRHAYRNARETHRHDHRREPGRVDAHARRRGSVVAECERVERTDHEGQRSERQHEPGGRDLQTRRARLIETAARPQRHADNALLEKRENQRGERGEQQHADAAGKHEPQRRRTPAAGRGGHARGGQEAANEQERHRRHARQRRHEHRGQQAELSATGDPQQIRRSQRITRQ
ncbi:hypothetical protein KCU90_g1034, partial [Aureobasidium melanogenum]